jgi:hypothetical protein
MIPEVKVSNFAFRNKGNLQFESMAKAWGLERPSFSNGAAYADLDNDGDLDYVVNNIDEAPFLYRNTLNEQKNKPHYLRLKFAGNHGNPHGLGAKVWAYANGKILHYQEHWNVRGYLSSMELTLHIGLGSVAQLDSLRIVWPDDRLQVLRQVKVDQVLTLEQTQATRKYKYSSSSSSALLREISKELNLNYVHQEADFIDFNIQRTLPHKLSQSGPALAVGDINGDGLEDVFITGSFPNSGELLFQQKNGQFSAPQSVDLPPGTKKGESTAAVLFDADGDGDKDLYIVRGGYEFAPNSAEYQDLFLRNEGQGILTLQLEAIPSENFSGSCVQAADYDGDGDLDLFVGGRCTPGKYPLPSQSLLLRNDSNGSGQVKFTDVTTKLAPELSQAGMITAALWVDVDQDRQLDLMLAGEWMPLTWFKNQGGKLQWIKQGSGLENHIGWWNSLAMGDFDQDGDQDFLAGNLGLNSLLKASANEPLQIASADFDDNGNYDPILFQYGTGLDGKRRPYVFNTRDDLIKQWLLMRDRFPKYADFASATFDNVLKPEEKQKALLRSANYLQSSFVENLGKGKFAIKALPNKAQWAPIYGILPTDLNRDGYLDMLMSTNGFDADVFTGRYDALNGLVMLGDGNGGFRALSWQESGVLVKGDGKACVAIQGTGGQAWFLMSQNRNKLMVFGLNTLQQ